MDTELAALLERIEDAKDTIQDEEVPLDTAQDTVADTLEAIASFEDDLTDRDA